MTYEKMLLIVGSVLISAEVVLLSLSLYLISSLSNNPDVDFSFLQPNNQIIKNL